MERWIDRIELAMRIDGVPESKYTDVPLTSFGGAGLRFMEGTRCGQEARCCNNQGRALDGFRFGLQRMEAWSLASASRDIGLGETVDVLFEELKKLVGIATEGGNAVGRVAACLLIGRLPSDI